MNEETEQVAEKAPPSVAQPRKPSAGEMLRQAREDGGLHIAALAVALKVSVKKLEALEADRFDLLPDAVFVRAMASSVCRALKIDPAPVLEKLPQTAVPRLEYDGCGLGLNTPFQTPGDLSRVSMWDQLSRPIVLVALALLVGALVLIFFPSMDGMSVPGVAAPERAMPESPKPALEAPKPIAAAPATAVDAAIPARKTVVGEPAVEPVAPGTPSTSLVHGKATRDGVVVFKTQGPSWVEVTDALGEVQIRRTISVGEVVGVSGPLPLSVVVGRADITEVLVRGKPFSLENKSRENVARFEVK